MSPAGDAAIRVADPRADGEGRFEIAGERRVVRRHEVIFLPPGVAHAFYNTGLDRPVFPMITAPVKDE